MTDKPNSGTLCVSRELKPCPCGAACTGLPYCIAPEMWRMDCQGDDCGWCVISGSEQGCLDDWSVRAQPAEQQDEPVACQLRFTRSESPKVVSWNEQEDGVHQLYRRPAAQALKPVGRYIEPGPRYKGAVRTPQIRSYEEYSEQAVADSSGYWVEGAKVYKVE